ncbi:hypothetical protein Q5Y73_12020 [Chengkuizengella sp. 2205SS18-9]|uniref:Tissue inhibitor of metalloproteinase n=2 Tax=Chengkuizengella axinellae TaxID=3064388 RepID=A0ABT9IZN3_9BACL|nr:hypothetical protein [Chengkuizengella sp. 2205SS18-9]MDP5274836.1 hypothetical protein [Chengkuizengella sp. 2205SS18-9]
MLMISTIFVLISFMIPFQVLACSCIGITSEEAFENADAVFLGKVLEVSVENNNYRVEMEVSASWKGVEEKDQTLFTSTGVGASCGILFEESKEYIVYAFQGEDGELTTNICSRTDLISNADEDLIMLETKEKIYEQQNTDQDQEDNTAILKSIIFIASFILVSALIIFLTSRKLKNNK